MFEHLAKHKDHPLWLEDRTALNFQHAVGKPKLPKVFQDGIHAVQDI